MPLPTSSNVAPISSARQRRIDALLLERQGHVEALDRIDAELTEKGAPVPLTRRSANVTVADRILAAVAAGKRFTAEIAEAIPESPRTSVIMTLSTMARDGRLRRIGHGCYALPEVSP